MDGDESALHSDGDGCIGDDDKRRADRTNCHHRERMKRRLMVAVMKNGRRLGTVGCLDRGILGVSVAVGVRGGLNASTLDVPGHTRPDEVARWSFGAVKAGDVVTLKLLSRGNRTRPDERERKTLARRLAAATEGLRLARKRRLARAADLERMLRTRNFKRVEGRTRSLPTVRVWLGEEVHCTVGAEGANSIALTLQAVFRPGDRSPSFNASAIARTRRELLTWDLPRPTGTIRVEVLSSEAPTRPSSITRRQPEPSSRAQVLRELTDLKVAQQRHAEQVKELEQHLRAEAAKKRR